MEQFLKSIPAGKSGSCWKLVLAVPALVSIAVVLRGQGSTQANTDPSAVLAVENVELGQIPTTIPGEVGQYLPITVQLRNVSPKAVTAYEISFDLLYSDRTSTTTGWTEDLAFPIAASKLPGALPMPNTTLNPGDLHSITQQVRLDHGGAWPIQAVAHVLLVVFGDRTGLGDPKKLSLVFLGRRETAEHLANLVAQVTEAESSPGPEARYREMISASQSVKPGQGPLGAYAKRLEKYLAVRGTAEFAMMLKVDEITRDGLVEQSVPASTGDGGAKQ